MCSSSIPRSCSVEKENISSFKTRLNQVSPFHTENLQCGQDIIVQKNGFIRFHIPMPCKPFQVTKIEGAACVDQSLF